MSFTTRSSKILLRSTCKTSFFIYSKRYAHSQTTFTNRSKFSKKITILGSGNIGLAIAKGVVSSNLVSTDDIILTKRNPLAIKASGPNEPKLTYTHDNKHAVSQSDIVIIAVTPQQLPELLDDIVSTLHSRHNVISVVTGAEIGFIKQRLGHDPQSKHFSVIRAMPNTAIAYRQSMTCIAASATDLAQSSSIKTHIDECKILFDSVGKTMIVGEDQIIPATALCACGVAFFSRAIRAAAQGGVEVGFHAHEAIALAAQTAKGAATLLLESGNHPESEVDKVTTPQGVTIAGLNQMEHSGFSSAFIKGIITSCERAHMLAQKKK